MNMRVLSTVCCLFGIVCCLFANAQDLAATSEWKDPNILRGTFPLITRHTHCLPVPKELRLCHGFEYDKMRLPNLLGHETIAEVTKQSSSWPPLVSSSCHAETRKLLCSLFAPVCMKGHDVIVPPCRSLCVAVRDACAPTMGRFGYSWPQMLNCSHFPSTEEGLCIPGKKQAATPDPPLCLPCRPRQTLLAARKKFCGLDFVIKIQVRRLDFKYDETRIAIQRRTRRVFKRGRFSPKPTSLWIRGGLHCSCDVMKSSRTRLLVTGWQVGRRLVVNSIAKWGRSSRKFVRKMRRSRCEDRKP